MTRSGGSCVAAGALKVDPDQDEEWTRPASVQTVADPRRRDVRVHRVSDDRRDRGFTVLELVAVMVVLALLMGVGVPLYLGAKRHAYRTAVQADLRSARVQIETWVQDQPDGYVLLTNSYFHNSHGMKWRGSRGVEISVSNSPSSTATTYCLKGSHPGLPGESWRFKGGVDSQVLKANCDS